MDEIKRQQEEISRTARESVERLTRRASAEQEEMRQRLEDAASTGFASPDTTPLTPDAFVPPRAPNADTLDVLHDLLHVQREQMETLKEVHAELVKLNERLGGTPGRQG
jgi:hypothetical protein